MIEEMFCIVCGEQTAHDKEELSKNSWKLKCQKCGEESGLIKVYMPKRLEEEIRKRSNNAAGKAAALEEFVRCEDCFYNSGDGEVWCEYWDAGTEPDAFCSRGERRREVET